MLSIPFAIVLVLNWKLKCCVFCVSHTVDVSVGGIGRLCALYDAITNHVIQFYASPECMHEQHFYPFPFHYPKKLSEAPIKIPVYLSCGFWICGYLMVWVLAFHFWHIPWCSMCIFVFVCPFFSFSISLILFISLLSGSMFSQYLLYADTWWAVLLRWHSFSFRFDFRSFSRSVFRFQCILIIIIVSCVFCVLLVDFYLAHRGNVRTIQFFIH